jgi:F-box domain
MEKLPDKLVAKIFDSLSLRDTIHVSYVSRLWNTKIKPYLRKTYNLNSYLEQTFPNPTALLKVFRESGAILSGSRAYSYFLPAERMFTAESDWDVYVSYPNFEFLKAELECQGFNYVPRTKPSHYPDLFRVHNFFSPIGVKVQVNELTEKWSLHACIKNFHVTVVQNFISGRGCCSVRWGPTFDKMGYFARRIGASEWRNKEMRKWSKRGVLLKIFKGRKKVLGDSNSALVVWWGGEGKERIIEHIPSEQLGKRFQELY